MPHKPNPLDNKIKILWGDFKDSAQFWRKHGHLLQEAQYTQQELQSPLASTETKVAQDTTNNTQPASQTKATLPNTNPVSVYSRLYGVKTAKQEIIEKAKAIVMVVAIIAGISLLLFNLVKMGKAVKKPVLTKQSSPKIILSKSFDGYKVNPDFKASYDSLPVDSLAWKKHELILLKNKEKEYETGFVNAVKSPQVIKEYTETLIRIRKKLKLKQQAFVASYQAYLKHKNQPKDTVIVNEVPPQEIKQLEKNTPSHFIPHHRLIRFVLTKDRTSQRSTPHNLKARNQAVYQLFMPGDTLVYFIKGSQQTLRRVRKVNGKFYATVGKQGQLFKVNTTRYHIYQADLTLAWVVGDETRPVKGLKAVLYKQQGNLKQFYIPQGEWLNTRLHLSVNAHAHYD